jgi:Mce-associated membrane protein
VPASRHPSPPRSRPRARSSGVDATAVRRLAARHAGPEGTGPKNPGPKSPGPKDHGPEAGTSRAGLPWGLLAFVALTVVTLVCGGLAAWFGTEANGLSAESSARNHALSAPGATSQVTGQVTRAVNSLFSYNYANPGPTQKAARRLLTGAAVKQYAALFAGVQKNARQHKLVVTTTVSNAGVEMLTGGTARVLVFATESDGSAGVTAPTVAEAMLAINALQVGSAWKIEGIDTFAS